MRVGGDVLAVVLALRALGLGDLLTAVPALRGLARSFPSARLALACPQSLWPLVALVHDGYERVDVPGWVGRRGAPEVTFAACLPRSPSLAVNLHGRGPESTAVLRATRPERLIAYEAPGGPVWGEDEHEVDRWCRLLCERGIPADPADLDLPVPAGVVRDPSLTLLHPGAASAARRWPAERWAAVARAERDAGRKVALTGSAVETPLARRVAELADLPPKTVLAGRTDLLALAELVATAGRVVCGDTGIAHLATALRTPSVVLFGPTDPARWGPPPDRAWHRALWSGRTGDAHAAEPNAGLLAIGVESVLAALADLPKCEERPSVPA